MVSPYSPTATQTFVVIPESLPPLSRRPPRPSTSYGTLPSSRTTTAPAKPDPSKKPPTIPSREQDRPPPVGPLSRVPSNPSFVPSFIIDLDAVATNVSERVGAVHTAQDLLQSLDHAAPTTVPTSTPATTSHTQLHPPHSGPHPFSRTPPQVIRNADDLWESSREPDYEHYGEPPLEVVLARKDPAIFDDEALVLKIRPQEPDHDHDHPADIENNFSMGKDHAEADVVHDGFAINIPVSKDPDPSEHATDYTQEPGTSFDGHDRLLDEEDPLLPEETGLNMSSRKGSIPLESHAFVQRYGPRNVASEQEVLLAVNAEKLGSGTTGLFLPVMDSHDDLTQLMFIHPPAHTDTVDEGDVPPPEHEEPATTTAEDARVYVESLSKMIPPIIDMESTLEVHGTAKNATVSISVTKQVSWVGYLVLAVALLSVASQGTAVKWLPSVEGLLAATWLMQTQTLLMLPFAIFQYCTLNSEEQASIRKPETWKLIILASLSQVWWASGFFVAIDYTTLFHAWALNNIHALLIVLIAVVRKTCFKENTPRVSKGEVTGARVALLGVMVMQLPAFFSGSNTVVTGDCIAIFSSLGAIAFLNICKTLRNDVPLFLMMTPITALNAAFMFIGSMMINGTDLSVSDHGALGWMSADRMILGLYLGGVVGFLGTVCCIAALKFLPSVVVGSVQTMMPVAGTLVAVIAGVDTLPDFWSTVGGLILLYGVLIIADATRQTEDLVIVNQHICEVGAVKSGK